MEVFIMLVLLPIIILVAVPIIILIFNSKKLKQVTQRVENIETKIERLERLMNARETTIISELPDTLPDQEIVVETIPEEPGALPPAEKPGLPAPKPMPAIVREPGIKKSRSRDEWETVIGGRWLNRIGALALIIGFGFFLKFAFDNKWLTETVQVLIGAAFGSALLFGGWRFHQQDLKIFARDSWARVLPSCIFLSMLLIIFITWCRKPWPSF